MNNDKGGGKLIAIIDKHESKLTEEEMDRSLILRLKPLP